MKIMPVAMLRKVAASSKYCICDVANRNFKENCLNHFKICHLEIMPHRPLQTTSRSTKHLETRNRIIRGQDYSHTI